MTRGRGARVRALLFLLLGFLTAAGRAAAAGRSLSVDEAIELAGQNNEAVRIKALQAEKSQELLTEARAKAFPRISIEASGSYLANPPEGVMLKKGELVSLPPAMFPPAGLDIPSADTELVAGAEPTYFKASVSLTQPLFTWGKIASAIKLAAGQLAISRLDVQKQQVDLEKEVRSAYFGALLARSSLPLLTSMREMYAAIVKDRQQSFDEGASTRQDVLEAEAALASLEARLVEAGEALATALEGLRVVTGLSERDFNLTSTFREELPAIDEESLTSAALASSKDRELAMARSNQARVAVDLAKGGSMLLPDLSFAATVDVSGQKVPFSESEWTDSWDWGLTLSIGTRITAFDAGESWARAREAEKDLETSLVAAAQVEKLLKLAVRKAVQSSRTSYAGLSETRAKAALAAEQARNARVLSDNELATREDLNMAKLGSLSAELELMHARYTFESALGETERLTGARLR